MQAQFFPPLGTGFFGEVVERDAAAVGDSHHPLEVGDVGGSLNGGSVAESAANGLADFSEVVASADGGVTEAQQQGGMWDAGVDRVVNGARELVLIFGLAPTEQVDVRDRSIEALVKGGDAGGHDLQLGAGERTVLSLQVRDLVPTQVVGVEEVIEPAH